MEKPCFFCDVQENNPSFTHQTDAFFARFCDFPVNKGHTLIVPKEHFNSFFELSSNQLHQIYELIQVTKKSLDKKFSPNGYNIGINQGVSAGQSVMHLHVHVIPRYTGDVENPRGGVRNIIPSKADYIKKINEQFPEKKKYVD